MAVWVGVAGNYQTSGGTNITVPLPTGWAAGDLAFLTASGDSATDPGFPTPPGWTFRVKTAAGNMFTYIWTRVLQAGDTGLTVNMSGTYSIAVWRDATLGTIGTFGVRSGTSFTVSAPDISGTGYRAHIFADRSIAATAGEADALPTLTYGTPRGFYAGNPTLNAALGISATYFADSAAGASGPNTATMKDSAGNAWGIQIDLGPGTAPAPTGGRPSVWNGTAMVAKPGKVWSGTAWVEKIWKHWTGSEWKPIRPAVWAPDQIPGLVAWIDPAKMLFSDGAPVTSFTDQKGRLFQPYAYNNASPIPPVFRSSIGGKPGIEFQGQSGLSTLNYFIGTDGLTFIIVGRSNALTAYSMLMTRGSNVGGVYSGHGYEMRQSDTTALQCIGDYMNGGPTWVSSFSHTLGVDYLDWMEWEPNVASRLFVNGTDRGIGTAIPLVDEGGDISIGTRFDGYCWTGLMREALVYNRILTAAERNQLQTHLMTKYSLSPLI